MPQLADEQAWHAYVRENVQERLAGLDRAGVTRRAGEGAGADRFAQAVLDRRGGNDAERLALLSNASPYFGRIDRAAGDALYVGRLRVRDLLDQRPASHGDVVDDVVTNWQAAAASPFYTARPGASEGALRRRRYRFDGDRLLGFDDEVLARRASTPAPPRFGAVAKPTAELPAPVPAPGEMTALTTAPSDASEARGVSDMLLEELSRSRDGYMRDIVSTIQAEQYDLMEAGPEQILAIQGAPGTGKTAIALHRLSLIAFRHPAVRRGGLLMVGPNERFVEYVSRVLPGLGDQDVRHLQVTGLGKYTAFLIEEDRDARRIKGDARCAKVLRAAVDLQLAVPDRPFTTTLADVELTLTRPQLRAVLDLVQAETQVHDVRRERIATKVTTLLSEQYVTAIGGASRLRWADVPDPYSHLSRDRQVRALLELMAPRVTAEQQLEDLWSSSRRLLEATRGLLTHNELDVLWAARDAHRLRSGGSNTNGHTWTDADLPLLDELDHLITGPPAAVGHIAVDEAQDLSPMQLRMVGRRLGRTSGATLLGDLAQATGPFAHRSWDDITMHLGARSESVVAAELTHGYRVPGAILGVANQVLPHTGTQVSEARAVREIPDSVVISQVPEAVDLARTAVRRAVELAWTSLTAILVATWDDPVVAAVNALGRHDRLQVLTPEAAKGLEFDHVVLVEPASFLDSRTSAEEAARALYVALTRPTTSLTIVHRRPLPFLTTPTTLAGPGAITSDFSSSGLADRRTATPSSAAVAAVEPSSRSIPAVGGIWPHAVGRSVYRLSKRDLDVVDLSGTRLRDVVEPARAEAVARRLLAGRPDGGRIRVDADGHVTTLWRSRVWIYVGCVTGSDWFPDVVTGRSGLVSDDELEVWR